MSLTEKSSVQGQNIETERACSKKSNDRSTSSSREGVSREEYEEDGSRADSESEEEYDEIDEDEDETAMVSSPPYNYPTRDTDSTHPTFSESFQRFTSLPSMRSSTSNDSSSHKESFPSIRITPSHTGSEGTAIHTLPSLRSLPIHPSHHTYGSPHTHGAHTDASSDYPHRAHILPPLRSPSPERPRRNSVMRLENILNTTSVDTRYHIPRPHSAGDTRHATSHPWASEWVKDPPQKEIPRPYGVRDTAQEPPARRLEFRVISRWDQGRVSSKAGEEHDDDDDDDDDASVTSTEGLSTMDVDMDTPPPTSASTTDSKSVSTSSLVSVHDSRTRESSAKSSLTLKPKRKVKMHPCPECHKEFPRPSGLKTHMTIHTKEKPFSCAYPGCNRTFSVVSNAKRHMRSHGTGAVADPSNPNPTLSFDPSSSYTHKKGKERAFVVDFDEPVVVDPSPPIFILGSTQPSGGMKLRWPAKGIEMVAEGDQGLDSGGHGTGAMVGSHRGGGKRGTSSAAHSRTGSFGGTGARAAKGDGGSGSSKPAPSC